MIDETHNPALLSWVASANAEDTDFPIQNLPFGRFRLAEGAAWQVGVAIGDQVLSLHKIGLIAADDMVAVMNLPPAERRALRLQLSQGLRQGSAMEAAWIEALLPQAAVRMGVPCEIGDYTDFYVGIHHATAVGKLFRPDNPLLPNYKWVPIGYHGRSSTVMASGVDFPRPVGQLPGGDTQAPAFGPSKKVDLELELGIFVGRGNAPGQSVPIEQAESHIFGMALFNDWSARDVQAWEYQPLGPFLSKNFASTVSPWIVTLEALAPFRRAFERPANDPQPLPYLDSQDNRAQGAFDIDLEVWLQTSQMRAAGSEGERISRSNFAGAAYWTAAQLVTHHTVNGCSLRSGDLLGTGTLSGPAIGQEGSMLEKTLGGKQPVSLSNGEQRCFLEDGDAIVLRGRCEREGRRSIGFGECRATLLPAR
jgi:fumarylacetoacetase